MFSHLNSTTIDSSQPEMTLVLARPAAVKEAGRQK